MNTRKPWPHHIGDEQPQAPRLMPLPLALVVIPLSAVAALVIEGALLVKDIGSAAWAVLVVGKVRKF